jgi:hypothetical protein
VSRLQYSRRRLVLGLSIKSNSTPTATEGSPSHIAARTNNHYRPDESRQFRQSRAAHTHPIGPAQLGVLQPHLLSVLVGWAQLARKLFPATPAICIAQSLIALNHRPKAYILIPRTSTTSCLQAPQQLAIKSGTRHCAPVPVWV